MEGERCPMFLPQGLHLLDLPQKMDGFRAFISAWYFTDTMGRRVVVDPGPASTVPLLLEQLADITDGVDLVLLTHIHLDHAGGIGQFCSRYRDAKVLVHARGRKHLLAPEKLWKASVETLGDVALMYGAPLPLDPSSLLDDEPAVLVLETPGHAPHHLSFIVPFGKERLFFVGEAAGLCLPLGVSSTPYLRPTTPPKFDATAALRSLDVIDNALQGNDLLCYSHWGTAHDAKNRILLAKEQLKEWLTVARRMSGQSSETITEYLLEHDKLLGGFAHLPADLQERERIFIGNSVKGIILGKN